MCWCTMLLCMRLYHIHQNVYPPKYWASLRFCDFRQLWAGSLHKAITTTDLTTSTSIAIVLNVVLMNTMNTTNTTITTITTMITMQRCQRWRNGGKRLQCLANWTNTELGMYNLCSSQELTMKNWDDWFVGNIFGTNSFQLPRSTPSSASLFERNSRVGMTFPKVLDWNMISHHQPDF